MRKTQVNKQDEIRASLSDAISSANSSFKPLKREDDASTFREAGIDSMTTMMAFFDIEKKYGLEEIDKNYASGTISEFLDYVEKQRNQSPQ